MSRLTLGLIGLSEGNGHPYSWGAIFNGYNSKYMSQCPFPVIPEYLSKQQFPQDAVAEAEVKYIWTQSRDISLDIAHSANIKNIADNPAELIGKVDAILLARDDAENHYEMSKIFLEAGLPVYIDKPLAYSKIEAAKIYELEKYPGQIFTCSALTYGKEFQLSQEDLKNLGEITYIEATAPKSWGKYSVHIIEPVINLFCSNSKAKQIESITIEDKTFTVVLWDNGVTTKFSTLGNIPTLIKINVIGTKGSRKLIFQDSFFAFKKALEEFIAIVKGRNNNIPKDFTMKVIEIIEAGERNGKE